MLRHVLVIVHGLGRHASEWSLWKDAIVPDLPELRRVDRRPDLDRAIATVLSHLDDRGVARTTWLGHSFGAHVALAAAERHPERVERLILVAAAPTRRALDRVQCPVLIVLGALDGLDVAAGGHVQVETLDGVGHDPHLEAPERLRALTG